MEFDWQPLTLHSSMGGSFGSPPSSSPGSSLFRPFGVIMGGLLSPPLLLLIIMEGLQPPPLNLLVIVVGLPSPPLPLGL